MIKRLWRVLMRRHRPRHKEWYERSEWLFNHYKGTGITLLGDR